MTVHVKYYESYFDHASDFALRHHRCVLCCVLLTDAEAAACDPKCRYEVRQWKHGAYTLVHDTDLTACEYALDAIFFCCCKGLLSAKHVLLTLRLQQL